MFFISSGKVARGKVVSRDELIVNVTKLERATKLRKWGTTFDSSYS